MRVTPDVASETRSSTAETGLIARLKRGAAQAFVIHALGFVLALLAQIIAGRALGTAGYGVFAFVQSLISFLALLCGLGFPSSLLRYIPEYKTRDQWPRVRAVIRFVEIRSLLVSLAVTLLLVGGVTIFAGRLDQTFVWTIYGGAAAIPLLVLLRVRAAVLRGFGRILSSLGSEIPVREGVVLLGIGVAGLGLSIVSTAPQAIMIWTFGTALGLLIATLAWRRQERPNSWSDTIDIVKDDRTQWLQVAFMLLAFQGLMMALRRFDVFIVGWGFDQEMLGAYAAANRLADMMVFPSYVLNALFAPTIAELHSKGERGQLQKATTFNANLAFASAAILALPMLVAPSLLLGLFGSGFADGATALRYLVLGEFVAASVPFARFMLTMTGHERIAVKAMLITTTAACLAMVLAAATGPTELVALIRGFAIASVQIWFCFLVLKTLKVSPYPFGGGKALAG